MRVHSMLAAWAAINALCWTCIAATCLVFAVRSQSCGSCVCSRLPHCFSTPHRLMQVVLVTNTGKPLLRGMQGSASDSSDEDDDGPAAAPAAASSPNVLPTAEPPVVVSGDGSPAAGQQEGQEGQEPAEMPRPWSSPEEMETMARFGAWLLASLWSVLLLRGRAHFVGRQQLNHATCNTSHCCLCPSHLPPALLMQVPRCWPSTRGWACSCGMSCIERPAVVRTLGPHGCFQRSAAVLILLLSRSPQFYPRRSLALRLSLQSPISFVAPHPQCTAPPPCAPFWLR